MYFKYSVLISRFILIACSNINHSLHCDTSVYLTFMGPYIVNIFQYISNKMQLYTEVSQYISNKMQLYTIYFYLETALHVSGGTSTHHQERIQLHLQHLVLVTPLLLPAAIAVEQFADKNKLCKVASCILEYLRVCYVFRFCNYYTTYT